MNASPMFSLIDFVIAGCGLYVIYLYVDMKRTGKIRESMLLPKGLNVKRCKDVDGYIRMAGSKQLILGILALASGLVGLLQDFQGINSYVYMAVLFLFFIYAIWYTVYMKKVIKKLW